jgi:hypothetical protein
MSSQSQVERADHLSRKRAWFIGAATILFIVTEVINGPHFTPQPGDGVGRRWGWALFAIVLLLNLGTGGGLLLKREVRRLVNDEVWAANRNKALATGYWMGMIIALAVYMGVLYGLVAVSAMQALHIVVTASVATAMFAFSSLELRAHRNA